MTDIEKLQAQVTELERSNKAMADALERERRRAVDMERAQTADKPRAVARLAMPRGGSESVFDKLRGIDLAGMLDARQRLGIETYKQTLMTFDGRDAYTDLLQEQLDALVYGLKLNLEKEALVKVLAWLIGEVDARGLHDLAKQAFEKAPGAQAPQEGS